MNGYKIDGNQEVIFSQDMTVAELLDADYRLLSILERLDIQLPFGDISVGQMCERYDMSAELFLTICRIYANVEDDIVLERLSVSDLPVVLKFLESSHSFYLNVVLPRIERGVEEVLALCDVRQQLLLRRFYEGYASEIREHLSYEESVMFPYLKSLLAGEKIESTMIDECLDNHTDICEKIDDMKSIIIKYLPESCSIHQRCGLLYDIYTMREELSHHTRLEMELLAPLALEAERRIGL
jgi:regulator of cell morphogenesis and NO signaling